MALLCEDLSELYARFNEFRLDEKFCDVVIKVGERFFHCHRVILASALDYFRTTFSGNFSEGKKNEIELKGIDACDFELLLTHVYGKEIDIKEDNVYRLLRISHYMGPESFETRIINYIIASNSIPLDTALSIFMFACKMEKIVLIDKLVPFMAENFVTICKYVKFHRIDGKNLLQIMSHPQLDKDFTAILDFLGQWIRCVDEVNKKFLSEILAIVNLSEVPLDWILKTLSNCRTREDTQSGDSNIEESSNEKDVNEVEDLEKYSFDGIDAASEYEENIRENRLPFQVFTLDMLNTEPSIHAINTYGMMNRDNELSVQFNETKGWSIPQNFKKVYCKSVFVDALCFTIFCADIPGTQSSGNQYYYDSRGQYAYYQTYTFEPFIHYASPKKLKTYDLHNVKDLENVAISVNGTDIYLYNEATFAFYNTERDEWVNISSSTDFTKTQSPNLVSHESSLYLIGGKYLPVEAANTANSNALPPANILSRSQANGKSFQQFDPREGKWFQLPMMKYAHYKSASCIYNDMLYVSGGDDLAFFKGYIECFDFKAGKWNVFDAVMPEPKMNHILLAHNDKLWFFGGETYSQQSVSDVCSWYAYDMKEQNWTDIFHMPKSYGKFKTKQILDVVINM